MSDFKINQGIYWLKNHTSFTEEELQRILDSMNSDSVGDAGKVLTEKEVRRVSSPTKEVSKVKDLLLEWIEDDYQVYNFEASDAPSFMLVDDGDGRLEVNNSKDSVFYADVNEQGKSAWFQDVHTSRLWSYLSTTENLPNPPLTRLHQQNIYRVKEAYLRLAGRADLFGFEDVAGLLENLQDLEGGKDFHGVEKEDYQFLVRWFVENKSSWIQEGMSGTKNTFEFKLGISLLIEMGHQGGGIYVMEALNELKPHEWQALFRDPDFSKEIVLSLAGIINLAPSLAQITLSTEEGKLVLASAVSLSSGEELSQEKSDVFCRYFCDILEKNRKNSPEEGASEVYPGELLVAVMGLKNLLGWNKGFNPPSDLVTNLYNFISNFKTVSVDKMELPSIPSGISRKGIVSRDSVSRYNVSNLYDQERWIKAKAMDINLDILRDAFIALEMAGLDGRRLRQQIDKATLEDKDPEKPEDVLTALFMILNSDLPEVPRTEAYVQFYKRVLARQMLARRRGDNALANSLERLQTMNQIGRELERMFWGNAPFRESLLKGHEEELHRQLLANLDSHDLLLSRNYLPLAIIKYLFKTYALDDDGKLKKKYRRNPDGRDGVPTLRFNPYDEVWNEIGYKMKTGEINLGSIVKNNLTNAPYENNGAEGFSDFLRAGQFSIMASSPLLTTPLPEAKGLHLEGLQTRLAPLSFGEKPEGFYTRMGPLPPFEEILKWCEGREDELPFNVFLQMLNDTELNDYIIGGKDARAQAISAVFILRSWSSGIHGRIESYFDDLDETSDPNKFTITERIAFLEGFKHSDLRHLLPNYLIRFFTDPNELVREKAFEIYRDLGFPTAIARNFIGRFFDFEPDERRRPEKFMEALDKLEIKTEKEGHVGLSPLPYSTKEIIGETIGAFSTRNATSRFLRSKGKFEREEIKNPDHLHQHEAFWPMSEACYQKKTEKLINPSADKPFEYKRTSHQLVDSGDRRVVTTLIDAFLMEAPVYVGERPLYPVMPVLDTFLSIFNLGNREVVEGGLVSTISHSQKGGLIGDALPGLLLEWGRKNRVDVVEAFRKAIFQYDSGYNLEIDEKKLRLTEEKSRDPLFQDQRVIDQLEGELIELYADEFHRCSETHPEAIDQLIASLYNEVRKQYLIDELSRFNVVAIQEMTRRIEVLSKKIEDGAVSPVDSEKYQIQRDQLLKLLLAIQ